MSTITIPLATLTHPDFIVAFSVDEEGGHHAHCMRIICERTTYTHKCNFDTTAEAEYQLGKLLARGQINTEYWHIDDHGIFDTDKDISGDEPCQRCHEGGRYIYGVENDKLLTNGTCYRCGGKGFHTQADRARNLSHDLNFVPVL